MSQLRFAEVRLEHFLDDLMRQSEGHAIIIVQSDHGPYYDLPNDTLLKKYTRERCRILNAFYLPGKSTTGLYKNITPVNSFRVVLNDYFNAGLRMLPDRTYSADQFRKPYEYKDVTDSLTF